MDREKIIAAFQRTVDVPAQFGLNDEEIMVYVGMVIGAVSKAFAQFQPDLVRGYLRAAISDNGLDTPKSSGGMSS